VGDKAVLITGAAGMLGQILRRHLEGRHPLRLLDIDPRGDESIVAADLSRWDMGWVERFRGVEVVVHLAADPVAQQTWPRLVAPNLDAMVNTFLATAACGVRRVVFASSNHVLGGYADDPEPASLTAETPPRPGAKYWVGDEFRDSTAYAATKLFGERVGKCMADAHGLEVIAVRIGWAGRLVPPERDAWWHQMYLTDRDFCHLMERCIVAELQEKFTVVNGMSANPGSRWGLEASREVLGYEPGAGTN
jgi:nucleoside-diphosphate-sugar epimerase